MQCDELKDLLDEALDARTDWESHPAVCDHLAGCDACREHAAAYRLLLTTAPSLQTSPPDNAWTRQTVAGWRAAPARHTNFGRWQSWAMLATAAAVLLAALPWIVTPPATTPQQVVTQSGDAPHESTAPPIPARAEHDQPHQLGTIAREAGMRYRSLAEATRNSVNDALLILPGIPPRNPVSSDSVPPLPAEPAELAGADKSPWMEEVTTGVTAVTGVAAGTFDALWQAISASDEDSRS